MTIHNIIDKAEREVSRDLNIHLVIHMDPICIITDEIKETWDYVEKILREYKEIESMHDFRIIGDGENKNLIFDVVFDHASAGNTDRVTQIIDEIKDKIKNNTLNIIVLLL